MFTHVRWRWFGRPSRLSNCELDCRPCFVPKRRHALLVKMPSGHEIRDGAGDWIACAPTILDVWQSVAAGVRRPVAAESIGPSFD